jgi:hypothetical protein
MRQKLSIRFLFILTVFSSSIFFGGCSKDDTTTPPANQTVTPKSGTSYTYAKHEKDSTSGQSPMVTDSTIIATVISGGTTFEGKSNVVTLYDDFDTLRYQIESSNDISIYRSTFGTQGFLFVNPSPWLLLPFGSKSTGVQLFAFDTTVTIQGFPVPFHVVGTADYLGTDAITKNGSSFASGGQVKVTITITGNALGTSINVVSAQTYSFDPTIGGYFHSTSNTSIPDVTVLGQHAVTGSTSSTTKILTDFSLIK